MAQYVTADKVHLGTFWVLGPVGMEQTTFTLVNSWSLKQGVCIQIAYWEQPMGCFRCQIMARNSFKEFLLAQAS